MGKSSSGKDTIFNNIRNNNKLKLGVIVPYTTRPIRDGEKEGVEYHFVSDSDFKKLQDDGRVVEYRVYHTVHGDWTYFTVDDGNIDIKDNSYVAIGTLEAYISFVDYFGKDAVVPIYIEVDDGVRLERALRRERQPENQRYEEMCRRFLADQNDFSEEKIRQAGITASDRFVNDDLDECIARITKCIQK